MAESLGDAVLDLRTDDRSFLRGVERARLAAEKMGDAFGKVGKKLQSIGKKFSLFVTAPIVAGVGKSVKSFASFDETLGQIVGLVGIARDEVDALGREVLKLAPKVGRGPQELAEALFFITSAGLRGKGALDALTASAKGSAAGLGSIATVGDAATSAMNAFGSETISAEKAVAIIVGTVREGKASADSIAGALGRVLPIAAELGVGFDQVGASVAAMTRLGLDANTSVTSLRSTLSALITPTQQAKERLTELAVASGQSGLTFEGLRKELREKGLLSVLGRLRDLTQGNVEALSDIFPNIRALTGVLNLVGKNAATTRDIFASLARTTEGDLQNTFIATAGPARKFAQTMAALNAAAIRLGDIFTPVIIPVVKSFTSVLLKVSNALSKMDADTRKTLITVASFAAGIGPALLALGTLVRFVGFASGGIAKLIPVFAFLGRAVVASIAGIQTAILGFVSFVFSVPGAIAISVAAIIAAFFLIPNTLKKIFSVEALKALFNVVGVGIQNFLVKPIVDSINFLIEKINLVLPERFELPTLDPVSAVALKEETRQFGADVADSFATEFDSAKKRIGAVVSKIGGSISNLRTRIGGLFSSSEGGDVASNPLAGLENSLASLPDLVEATAEAASTGADSIKDSFSRAGDSITDALGDAIARGENLFKSLGNIARSVASSIISAFAKKQLASLFGKAGSLASIGSFFGGSFAEGGRPPLGRVSVVGEQGPELFVPDRAGTVLPSSSFGNGGPDINIGTINADDAIGVRRAVAEGVAVAVGLSDDRLRQTLSTLGRGF